MFKTCLTYLERNIPNRMLFYTQILLITVKTTIFIEASFRFIQRTPDPSRSYSAMMLRNGTSRRLTSQMVLKTSQKHKIQQRKSYFIS